MKTRYDIHMEMIPIVDIECQLLLLSCSMPTTTPVAPENYLKYTVGP